jgi:hypothetical protein
MDVALGSCDLVSTGVAVGRKPKRVLIFLRVRETILAPCSSNVSARSFHLVAMFWQFH